MSEMHLPPVRPYHPTTFLERGVAVPFTMPLLYGSRARPAQRSGLELILPNPSGGRGVYILPWDGVREFCQPTVHDTQLIMRILALPAITPNEIRRVAREIAAQGMAGEHAMAAAMKTIEARKDDLLLTNYLLLMALVEQTDQMAPTAPRERSALDLEQRAKRAIAAIAPHVERPAFWVANSLEALAEVLCSIGVRAQSAHARVHRALDMLRQVRTEIGKWSHDNADDGVASYADMICSVADLTLSLATKMFEQAHGLTDDVIGLLRIWSTDPDSITRMAGRPEWMLDGWDQICVLWQHASDNLKRRDTLIEIAQLVPVLPREVSEWAGMSFDYDAKLTLLRRLVPLNEDWRTGAAVLDMIARNEQLRALGCLEGAANTSG